MFIKKVAKGSYIVSIARRKIKTYKKVGKNIKKKTFISF